MIISSPGQVFGKSHGNVLSSYVHLRSLIKRIRFNINSYSFNFLLIVSFGILMEIRFKIIVIHGSTCVWTLTNAEWSLAFFLSSVSHTTHVLFYFILSFHSYISKVDVLKILVTANYKFIPSLDDILETSAVTRLRNQLLEAEHYQLAVEVRQSAVHLNNILKCCNFSYCHASSHHTQLSRALFHKSACITPLFFCCVNFSHKHLI